MVRRWMASAGACVLLACGSTDEGGLLNTPQPTPDAGTRTVEDAGHPADAAVAPADAGQAIDSGAADGKAPPPPADAGSDAAAAPATEVAPYFYTWGWGSNSYAFPSLAAMQMMQGGPSEVTIAFVLANNNACSPTTDIQDNMDDVKAFIAGGGHVKASFGGADGTYLESACTDATSLAAAITTFVDATGITDLDFDIEQGSSTSNATINAMRATALKSVQDAKGIRVAFTLPVNPNGLDDLGTAIVTSAVSAGVKISYVNVMTMDYGDQEASMDLGQVAIGSAEATAQQLAGIIPNLTQTAAYRMVGVTPMIGDNDDTEVFTVDNAKTLVTWAKANKLGLLAFWAIQRDEPCSGATNLDTCTGVNNANFEFNAAFEAVNP